MTSIPSIFILLSITFLVHSNECVKPLSEITVDASSRLNMTVYIESLCKYSREFLHQQLQPIYNDIKDKINIKFVTFALVESSLTDENEIKFKCLHGPRECKIDLFQTCALRVYRHNQSLQADIIFCTMRHNTTIMDCINELQLNQLEIENCINGNVGLYLTLKSQQEAEKVIALLSGVPAVIFNNMIDPVVGQYALSDLRAVTKRRMYLYYKNFEGIQSGSESSGSSSSSSSETV